MYFIAASVLKVIKIYLWITRPVFLLLFLVLKFRLLLSLQLQIDIFKKIHRKMLTSWRLPLVDRHFLPQKVLRASLNPEVLIRKWTTVVWHVNGTTDDAISLTDPRNTSRIEVWIELNVN